MAKSPKFYISCCTLSFCFCLFILEVSSLVATVYFAISGLQNDKVETVQSCLVSILFLFGAQFLLGILLACLAITCCCFSMVIWAETNDMRSSIVETWQRDESESYRENLRSLNISSVSFRDRFSDQFQGYIPFTESRDFARSTPPSYSQFALSN